MVGFDDYGTVFSWSVIGSEACGLICFFMDRLLVTGIVVLLLIDMVYWLCFGFRKVFLFVDICSDLGVSGVWCFVADRVNCLASFDRVSMGRSIWR